jgi:hypothetical protein
MPYADHGDPRNLTEKDLDASTKTEAAGGADVKTAKENVAELIRLEREAGEEGRPRERY